jgi:hypothetical protein
MTNDRLKLNPWGSDDQRRVYSKSVKNAERIRKDMLSRLGEASVKERRYAGVENCEPDVCGRDDCIEACPFGNLRRLRHAIPLALDLLRKADGPICKVRVARHSWRRDRGELREISILAAKQLNRRALYDLFNPSLVAVGTCKVFASELGESPQWVVEIHEVVAGGEAAELMQALSRSRDAGTAEVEVSPIDDLAQALSDVFRCDLQTWLAPDERPKKIWRAEYYRWLLTLGVGDRMIRYGCNRYFKPIKKQPRLIKPKIKKGHPDPVWLTRWQFGSHDANCNCFRCQAWMSGDWDDYRSRKKGR